MKSSSGFRQCSLLTEEVTRLQACKSNQGWSQDDASVEIWGGSDDKLMLENKTQMHTYDEIYGGHKCSPPNSSLPATKSIWRVQSTASCFLSLTFHGISFMPVSFPSFSPLPSALQIHALLSSNNCYDSSLFSIRPVPMMGGHSSFMSFSPSIKKTTIPLMSSIHAFIQS